MILHDLLYIDLPYVTLKKNGNIMKHPKEGKLAPMMFAPITQFMMPRSHVKPSNNSCSEVSSFPKLPMAFLSDVRCPTKNQCMMFSDSEAEFCSAGSDIQAWSLFLLRKPVQNLAK